MAVTGMLCNSRRVGIRDATGGAKQMEEVLS
jgi:hypothetical protein